MYTQVIHHPGYVGRYTTRVCRQGIPPGYVGRVYHPGIYTRLYTPGYTRTYTVYTVHPGTLSPPVAVPGEEALGSDWRLIRDMRRIVGSFLPKV